MVLFKIKISFVGLQLAFEAHDGQKRRSGEPFIIHPVEVARILGELVSLHSEKKNIFFIMFYIILLPAMNKVAY